MGLMVYSLDSIPVNAGRDYFVYLLDYGWDEPISNALRNNFDEMAKIAAKNRAVIIKGTEAAHFENEVMSWHHINNEDAGGLLPALLITNKHAAYFRDNHKYGYSDRNVLRVEDNDDNMKMILVPFKRFCSSSVDAVTLIQKIFTDIESGKDLSDFKIAKQMKKGIGHALVDSLILEPNFSGIGFSFNKFKKYITGE
jgi:hypothetical protein